MTCELGGIVLVIFCRFTGLKTAYNDYGVAAIPQPQSPSHRGPPHLLRAKADARVQEVRVIFTNRRFLRTLSE